MPTAQQEGIASQEQSPCRPSGQLVTPKPSGSSIIRRTASATKTPVRTPTKRVAVHSPSISPQKDSPIAKAKGIQSIDNIDSLKPAVLDQQLSRQIKYKKLSVEEVKQKVSGEEWRHEWDHPQILDELLSEPIPPNPAEVLGYDFDLEDPTTCTLLRTINGIRVGEHMRKHVLTVKKPEASRMHPKFGPFTLVTMDSDNGKLAVFNRKHDRAFTFKREDFPLDIRDLDFDTMDATTYFVICTLGPDILWNEVLEERKRNNITMQEGNGPFQVVINSGKDKMILFRNNAGDLWQSNLHHPPHETGKWHIQPNHKNTSITTQSTPNTNSSPNKVTTNRYDVLLDQDEDMEDLDAMSLDGDDHTNTSIPKATKSDNPDQHNGTVSTTDMDIDHCTGPKVMDISAHNPVWNKEDSDGDAANSEDEKTPKPTKLDDVRGQTSGNSHSSTSLLPNPDPFPNSFDGTNGQYLLTVEIRLQPGREHLDVLFQETKAILKYIQQVDPTAKFMSKNTRPDGTPYPPLTSPTDNTWPTSYLASQNWYQTSMGYLFQQDPITEAQLSARLDNRRNKTPKTSRSTAKHLESQLENGPVSMYATLNLFTSLPKIEKLLEAVNIDLRKSKVKVSLKDLQCWESYPKKMMCGVNGGLCASGVQQLLLHRLKELEKKLCRHGKLNTLEWYDEPLPDLKVSLRPIRPLRLPKDEDERARLTFEPFPWECKLVYYLEASDTAWQRLEPLLQLFVETNEISKTFGPSAYIKEVPDNKPSTEKVRSHHEIGRISMGYNLKTSILECSEVQLYDYEVKVSMEEVEEITPSGSSIKTKPKPPYAKTTLRKELQRIRVNGKQIFHTAVMTCAGPDTGLSRIVVADNPSDPLRVQKYEFAKKTVANLACFMHHWLISCGYNYSTRSRLMRSFYIEKAQLAEYSTWDPIACIASSQFASRTATYIEDNARYDPGTPSVQKKRQKTSDSTIEISTAVRAQLLKTLGKTNATLMDIGSRVSGVSPHTGDGGVLCESTVNSTNTANVVMKTKEFALQLAASKAKQADQDSLLRQAQVRQEEQEATIRKLREEMEILQQFKTTAEIQAQQGAPHLSGSGVSHPQDPGGGETLQGP